MHPSVVFKPFISIKSKDSPQKPLVTKPKQTKQGVPIQKSLEGIFQSSFVMLLLGKPGSGKTHLLQQMINRQEFYGKKYDRILYVTPSSIPGCTHSEINTTDQIDTKWLKDKIAQCQWAQNLLIVIDDLVAQIPSNQRSAIKTLFYDRRHLLKKGCISIIVTSQKYTCVPMWIRVCLTQAAVFAVQPNQIKTISNQLNTGKDKRSLDILFGGLVKHQFIFFNLQNGEAFNNQFNKI